MKRRILSIITALALCLSLCPTWAFATEADPSLCKHHPAHTADCGYTAPAEGHDCGHEHTEDCYTTDEAVGKVLDCRHSHDSACGYVQGDPGAPCGYVCRICPIEALIAALPEQVTEDNAADVRGQLDHILDLYRELDEGKQGQLDLSRCYELQEALDNANAPVQAAEEIDISKNLKNILTAEDGGCPGHTFTGTAQAAMIYVESGVHNVTFSGLNITASAMVGVAPGAAMNLTIEGTNTISAATHCAGIYVPVGATLVINGNGSLNVSGSGGGAGIGGAIYVPDENSSDGDPNCGTVVINGGTITAAGGGTNSASAGIGGATDDDNAGNGGTVTINGGTVTATGGSDNYYGGAGIGGAGGVSNEWYEIVSGNGGTLTINGGTVNLTAGTHDSQYPAYGFGRGSGDASTGTCELTLADASCLTLAEGTTLDPKGTYTINGDPTADMIVVPELVYTGEVLDTSGIKIDDSKTGTGTYFGQTFTVNASADGWTYAINPSEVKAAGDYTVTFSKEGHTSISKTFTVAKSGTQFVGDGEVKTYNGDTLTTSFSAGDTITIKAAPTPTGAAPTNSAMFAASFTAPTAGQMAVFVGDTQVSEAVGVDEDGTYTMTVSAADVLLAAGGPGTEIPLTARFTANDNMADVAGTVKVSITAVAKAEKDGAVIGYYGESGLDAALADKNNEGAVFTLLDNMERETDLKINISCTLDLNGKTIRSTGQYASALYTYYDTTVTIRGEGTVISEQGHGFSVGGTATLEGGTFISGAANCGGVYVQAGKLIVTGEAVVIENTGGGTGLGVGYNAEAQLSGGTYSSIWVDSPHTLAGLLNQEDTSRVAYYKDNTTLVTEGLDGKELGGTVTVKVCDHTGDGVCEYTPNENDASTHTKTCLACGYTETGDCGFEKTADPTADSHTGQCPNCKRDRSGAHSFSDWAGNPVARTCTVCGYEQTAVARVEKDSTTTYVGALADAFTEGNSGATVTLLSEVDLGNNYIGIRGSSTFTLDLNGQTVKASHYGAFDISGGSLTIQDSGTSGKIESSNITIKVTGGTLSIKSGTVSGFYGVQITSGTVNISGGAISGTENGLLVNGGGNIVLSGGAYSGRHAIWVDANVSVTLKDLLATGYAYHQNDIPVAKAVGFVGDDYEEGEVPLDATPAWLTGTVTVKECNHTGGLVPSENGYQHGGPCKCCGAELTAANHTLGADNQCSGCGAALAAKVEKSGSDTVYVEASGLADVFAENSGNDGATITLLDNITTSKQINVGADNLTLDLNGKTYTCTQNDFHLSFVSLTIKGSGAITTSGYYCLTMDGGTLNIESGSFSAKDSAVYVENNGRLQLTGGSFTGNQNAIAYASGEVKDALKNYGGAGAPHYAFYQDSSPYTPSGSRLPSGTFTVQECQHTGVEVKDLGSGKHGLDCPYCGYHSEHTTTLTATVSGNTVTFRGGCESCDYRAETLATAAFTIPKLTYGQTDQTVSCTWEHPNGYALMVQIDSGEELQLESSDTQVSLPLKQLFGSQEINAGNYQLHVYCRSYADVTSNVCSLPVTVEKAPLTPSITGTATKTYDGTTAAPEGLAITLTGLVEGDNVTATASYAYDNANAGENKTITASGITLTGADAGNYTLSSTTAATTGTITKSQPTIAFVSGYNPGKTYDGQTIPNPTADNLTITGAAFGNVDFTWSATPKNAGTYTLTASIPVTDNTEAAEAVLTVTISPKTVTPTVTITPGSYEYTGSAIHPSGSAVKVMDGNTVIPDSEYTLSYGENTQVGNGSVTVTDKENGNYTIAQTTETFTITAKPLTGAKVEVTGTFTYTGSAQEPTPTVTLDGKTLTANTDYTVAYASNTNAGAAKITVTGMGNYSGTAQGTFTISRATLTVDGTGTASGTYGAKLSELTVEGLTAKLNGNAVTGTWKLAGDTVPNVGDSGEYTATFTPATGAGNYNPLTAKVKLNIAKADYTGTTTASTSAKFGTTGAYDLSALLPDGATAGTATTTSDIFEGAPAVSGKTLAYTLKTGATVGSTGTITVPVTSANYKDFNLTITVTVTAKDVPTLAVSPITVTYTGEAIPGTAIKGTAKAGSTTVPGTWSFKDTAPVAVADSGAKAVTFTPDDTTKYAAAEGTVVVTINKATPTGAPKYTAISASGKTLADAGLTTEGGTFSTTGAVAWALGTDTAVTANTQYEWTFTPTDTANYTTLTGKITLWPYTTPVNPGGGGGYVPSDPGGSSLPVTTTGQGSSTVTTTTTAAPTASVGNGTATTTINTAMGNEIVKQAVANNSETVVIAPSVTGSVTKAEVSIPASTVGQIGSQTSASLTVSTPVADVTIPNGGLGSLSSAGGTVTVTAQQTGNSVELSVTAGGRTVQNVPGGVTLTVPAANTAPGTVAVLVHEDGTREVVRKSVADNGTVTIPLDGSAKLEIVDNSKYFADVPATSWAADAVAFASSHELFNGTSSTQFSPEQPMSRGMLAVVLHNLESNPTQALTGAFTDVDNGQWYAEGVAWAEAQGIIGGYGNGQFGPNDNITREQLAVMLWRYSGSPAATDRELHFADADKASDWALEALRWATENGIINGKGGGILDPTGHATRAETAQMLCNFLR